MDSDVISKQYLQHSLGSISLVAAPTDISLIAASVEVGPALVVLSTARYSSATTLRELRKSKTYYSQVLEVVLHVWSQKARFKVDREGRSVDLGVYLY